MWKKNSSNDPFSNSLLNRGFTQVFEHDRITYYFNYQTKRMIRYEEGTNYYSEKRSVFGKPSIPVPVTVAALATELERWFRDTKSVSRFSFSVQIADTNATQNKDMDDSSRL